MESIVTQFFSMAWLLQLGTIVIGARFAGILSRKMGVSALFGEILFGIILGTLVISQGWHFEIHLLEAIAEIGIIFLIFIIGLETDVKQILSVGFKGLLVALFGIVLPFIAGYYIIRFYGYDNAVGLFVASCFTATSIAISARVFMDLNFVSHPSSQTVLVAAVVDDILGFLIFTVVLILASQSGGDWRVQLMPSASYLLILLPALWFALPHAYKLLDKFGNEAKFVLVIGLLLIVGFLANASGLAPIVGAFFLGLALSRQRDPEIMNSSMPIYLFLAPIFFVFMGLQVNVAALWDQLPLALLLIVVATLTKLVGGFLGVVLCKGSWREGLVCGIGMVPRGEVGLIIAAIGKKMGVIDDSLFAAVTIMCIVTTLIVPLPLKIAIEKMVKHEGVPQS